MKKSLLFTTGLAAMVTISMAFTKDEPVKTKDEPVYKNLKVLPKKITKTQMDSVMHHFAGALGVRCNYCHMRNEATNTWDFASDENKHKLAARNMLKMMDKINDKYFDVTGSKKNKNLDARLMVTCYTCHHGKAEPATIPPAPERPQQRPATDSSKRNQ